MPNLLYSDLYAVMMDTGGLWQAASGKRIFLAGCSGFIGQWLLETLNYCAHGLGINTHMTGLSRREIRSETPYIDFVRGDIRDFEFPDEPYDYLIHAAGGYGADTFQTAVHGTERLIEFAKHAGVRRVLYLSSGAIYTLQPQSPDGAYAAGKVAAEHICATSGIDTRIARLFTFVGPLMDFDKYAIGKFIKDAITKGKVVVKGGRNVTRSYIYASEMIVSLWSMLLFENAGQVYNVGSSEPVTIREAAELVAEVCEVPLEEEEGEFPDSRYLFEDGNKPRVPLRDAIEKTVAWYREVYK